MPNRTRLLIGALTALIVSAHSQAECTMAATQAPLVELYTSEGCSSCPPADAWLSQQVKKAANASNPILLAFHVDYWDSLGWTDPFASAANSARQRKLASTSRAGVYTPGFFINGAEWRGFFKSSTLEVPTFQATAIAVTASLQGNGLTIDSNESKGLFVAISEDARETQIKAGENRGRLLKHDAVVRHWQPMAERTKLTLPPDLNVENANLVVWREVDGVAIGAAQLPLESCK
jgi:hypothetical protein